MNDEQLQAIKERAEAATPGPWDVGRYATDMSGLHHNVTVWFTEDDDAFDICDLGEEKFSLDNATFIASARADVPALVAEVERLRAELVAVRIAGQAYKALAAICPECGGSGEVDSGGFTPWGVGINETCPTCKGSGKAYNDADGAE